jgi:hypothetical protein
MDVHAWAWTLFVGGYPRRGMDVRRRKSPRLGVDIQAQGRISMQRLGCPHPAVLYNRLYLGRLLEERGDSSRTWRTPWRSL